MPNSSSLDRLFQFTPNRLPLRAGPSPEAEYYPGVPESPCEPARLRAVSGDECAQVLEQYGMVRVEERAGVVWMEQGTHFFAIPSCNAVPIDTLLEILDQCGLSTGDFVGCLPLPALR